MTFCDRSKYTINRNQSKTGWVVSVGRLRAEVRGASLEQLNKWVSTHLDMYVRWSKNTIHSTVDIGVDNELFRRHLSKINH